MSQQPNYGFPCVSDPNNFIPDPECSRLEEIKRHRIACENYGKPDYEPNKGCYSEYDKDGQLTKHVSRTSWGIGTNLIASCDECKEPAENLLTCHECGPEFCEICWPIHEKKHDEEIIK